MFKQERSTFNLLIISILLVLGAILVICSAFYVSSFVAILGLSMIFWGAILLYMLPVKHVPLVLLNTSVRSSTNNTERILGEFKLTEKGVYLPPKNLENFDSGLIFVAKSPNASLPSRIHEDNQMLIPKSREGVFLTPPGYALSMFFERELGSVFIKIGIEDLQFILPKLLVEKLELAQNLEVLVQRNIVTMKITGSIFTDICIETDFTPKSHKQIGCVFSSALACVLAKVSGKPVLIQNETLIQEEKTLSLDFLLLDN